MCLLSAVWKFYTCFLGVRKPFYWWFFSLELTEFWPSFLVSKLFLPLVLASLADVIELSEFWPSFWFQKWCRTIIIANNDICKQVKVDFIRRHLSINWTGKTSIWCSAIMLQQSPNCWKCLHTDTEFGKYMATAFQMLIWKTISTSSMRVKKMIIVIMVYDGCGVVTKSDQKPMLSFWCKMFVNSFTKFWYMKKLVLPMRMILGNSSMARRWSKSGKFLWKKFNWLVCRICPWSKTWMTSSADQEQMLFEQAYRIEV